MKKILILLFLSLSLSSPAFADKGFDLYQEGNFKGAAREWIKEARNGSKSAQYNLGIIYSTGEGVPKDLRNSLYWYEKSAQQGFTKALTVLGELYYSGNDVVEVAYPKAYEYFFEANKANDAGAAYGLGLMYESGNGVNKNLSMAQKMYRRAANYGSGEASLRLGYLYEIGKGGLVKNFSEALKWYRKSYNQGNGDATSAINRMVSAIKIQEANAKAARDAKILKDARDKKKIQDEIERIKAIEAEIKQQEAEKLREKQKIWGLIASGILVLLFLWRLMTRGKREAERLRLAKLNQDRLDALRDEKERLQREKEEEKERLHQLALKEEEKRIYAIQQKKLVYLKADKYLSEFESHLPFKLSANYSDLRVFYDEASSKTQTSFIETETSFKDGRLWNALISLLIDDHSLDTMSTIYFAKIRSLLDDENYLVIGETDLDINEFFDRSTQLELVDLISSCLMPKPIALFVILHLSREFRYPNEEERAESEFKLEHFIVKENSKVKIQKLFTKLDEYALKCVESYADISSKKYAELESYQADGFETSE
jgi:TPR repeat protein